MREQANTHRPDVAGVLGEVFDETDDVLVVDPAASVVEELITVAGGFDDLSVRVLARGGVLKHVMDDFLIASRAADLADAGTLEMRTNEGADNTLLVIDDAVHALVVAGEQVAALGDTDETFVGAATDEFGDRWEEAEEYGLRTPSISRVWDSLDTEIGPETRQDFENVLSSLETARGDGQGLDEVTISLLVAAKNNVLLYDISRWGEDVGIASKATFSRTKTRLEELGLLDTEKVPIDVGRPRLRLKLGDDRLKDADTDQLASVASSVLAS